MALMNPVGNAALNDVPGNSVGNRKRQLSLKEEAVAITCRVLRRLIGFRAYWLMVFEPDDIPDDYENCDFESRALRGSELSTLTGKHRDLGEKFIARSIRKGDWCYAYYDGDQLISYGYCSSTSTMLGDHFSFEFPEDYFYMHRGFTMRDYRGQRLNGLGMVEAIRDGAKYGKRGLVGLIEVQNVPSLRSAHRWNHRREGIIITFRLFGRWMTLRTPSCRRRGCRLVRRVRDTRV